MYWPFNGVIIRGKVPAVALLETWTSYKLFGEPTTRCGHANWICNGARICESLIVASLKVTLANDEDVLYVSYVVLSRTRIPIAAGSGTMLCPSRMQLLTPELIYPFILGQVRRSNRVRTQTGPSERVQVCSVQGSAIWLNLNLCSVWRSQILLKNLTEPNFGSTTREFVVAIADTMEGKTYSVSFTHMTNLSLAQPIYMPISSLVFSILTSAQVIS
jgi:hypothetical protein